MENDASEQWRQSYLNLRLERNFSQTRAEHGADAHNQRHNEYHESCHFRIDVVQRNDASNRLQIDIAGR